MNAALLIALLENVNHLPQVVRALVDEVAALRAELDALKAAKAAKARA